jgi:asparagine synthase (glutamine-hydrolysing)
LIARLGPRQVARRERAIQGMVLWDKTLLTNHILHAERQDMAHGLEVRMPLLDHQLFAAARALSAKGFVEGGLEKVPLRAAARGLVPDAVLARKKQGFAAPPVYLKSARLVEMVKDTLRSEAARAQPFFEPRELERMMAGLPREPGREAEFWDVALCKATSLVVLQQRFAVGSG